jgi:Uma2 family endonuclease
LTDMLVAPEQEVFPNRRRWTVETCYRLADAGELTGRWELIDGEVLSKMGQKPAHGFVLLRVATWLSSHFGLVRTRIQLPVRIAGSEGETNEPEPDIALVTEQAAEYYDRLPTAGEVLLVVEIADSSLAFDLGTKAVLYARCGVPEYWVVDVTNRFLYRHTQPSHSGYMTVDKLNEDELVTVSSQVSAQLAELLPPA